MAVVSEFPCAYCGSKKRFHKRGCSAMDKVIVVAPEKPVKFLHCCNLPMLRTNGGPRDVMCHHHRLLTDDCKDCRREHNGVLTYQCQLCGKQVKDAPHLAQGAEAETANSQVRK